MKVVNLLGGPGTGKSTTAAELFAELKHRGEKAELVTEFAKELVYEGDFEKLANQALVLEEQHRRQARLIGQVDWVITDSPLIFGLIYATGEWKSAEFYDTIVNAFDGFDNINVMLERVKPYATYGRTQTEDEARKLDHQIRCLPIKFDAWCAADRNAARAIADFVLAGTHST